jgi:probable HAF family extracellular repeat protein
MHARAISTIAHLTALVTLASLAATQASADPITYNVTNLSYLNATGFDQAGNVVGQYSTYLNFTYTASGPNAGLTQTIPIADTPPSGHFVQAGPLPGYFYNAIVAANASGQEVGFSVQKLANGDEGTQTGWLYSGGQLVALPSLLNSPIAINASGQIIGNSIDANGNSHAIVSNDGRTTDLGTLGGAYANAVGINNQGQIVGYTTTTLPGPIGSPTEIPTAVPFIYENGKMYNLNSLLSAGVSDVTLRDALGINNLGQIVATGISGGHFSDLLLTPSNLPAPPPPPIPEPSTAALVGLVITAASVRKLVRFLQKRD